MNIHELLSLLDRSMEAIKNQQAQNKARILRYCYIVIVVLEQTSSTLTLDRTRLNRCTRRLIKPSAKWEDEY